MADVQPFRALHYDLDAAGDLQALAAPPYDVIDDEQRAELVARSPHNVVEIDLPRADGDPYAHAAEVFAAWQRDGALVRDEQPALWALAQDYTGPDGVRRTRHGLFARVGIEDYGPGKVRPHERTHPGPKEDRLRLTRATRANLSPIFSLYDDPEGAAWGAVAPHLDGPAWGEVTDEDGTAHRLWRVADPAAGAAVTQALQGVELLIADGHHRYETALAYSKENPDPAAQFVMMTFVNMHSPGLRILATHRVFRNLPNYDEAHLLFTHTQQPRNDFVVKNGNI
jgi:uncharacterized protein (DUF1015 family)